MLLEITVVKVVINLEMEEERKREERKSELIEQIAEHDRTVFDDTLYELVEIAREKGFEGIYEYYYSLTDEELNAIAKDYFEEEDYIKI